MGHLQNLNVNPHQKQNNNLINLLKSSKAEGDWETTHIEGYIQQEWVPQVYGLPRIHKEEIPLRPIVSSWRAVRYIVAKEFARIFRLLVVYLLYHIRHAKGLVEQVKNIKLEEGKCIISYALKALFISLPVEHIMMSSIPSGNKMKNSVIEHLCPSVTPISLLWSFSRMSFSFSRVSIINKYKKQLWGPP